VRLPTHRFSAKISRERTRGKKCGGFRKVVRVQETIAVRAGEALDVERLEPFLRANLPATSGPLRVRQFAGGHANLTYLCAFDDAEYVLRRPPHGPLPKGGHDMRREYRVLSRLWEAFPLAPRAFALCTDAGVLGSDFVLMERRRGIVIRTELPAALQADEDARRRLGENFIDTLAALHEVDYARIGLADLGKPDGYLERQLRGWVERWEAAATPGRVDATRLVARLGERLPHSGPPGLVHNDFKFDNTLLAQDDPTRLVAILDWDMCTLGDPLADLGNVLSLWMEPGDDTVPGNSRMPTALPGFMTRAQLVERYARVTGRDCSRAAWYHAFNVFRYAAIAQQIYARYVRGQTQDGRFAKFDFWVTSLVRAGIQLADGGI
jgi:aminoglycoside phosphotransferase (APT) family kinase protein